MLNSKRETISQEPTTRDILDAILNFSERMDNEFVKVRTELRGEMHDGFTNVRSDIRQLWDQLGELKVELEKLSKRTIEDADVNSKDIVNLQKKYKKFEIRLKKLETQKVRNLERSTVN